MTTRVGFGSAEPLLQSMLSRRLRMKQGFISYSRSSKETADHLVRHLTALGLDVWIDRALSGGQEWWAEILSKIRACDVFVVLIDRDSLNSSACQREFRYARSLGRPILPILIDHGLESALWPELARLHHVDYRKRDADAAVDLARALQNIPAAPELPLPLPPPPDAPIAQVPTNSGQHPATVEGRAQPVFEKVIPEIRWLRNRASVASVSALSGATLAAILTPSNFAEWTTFVLMVSIGWAISGAIAGPRLLAVLVAVSGAMAGYAAGYYGDPEEIPSLGLLFSIPGAFIGSLLGVFSWRWRRLHTDART